MKSSITLLLLTLSLFTLSPFLYAAEQKDKPVAVVRGQYEKIDTVLNTYGIPFTIINYHELENPETLKAYRAVFFPCGVRKPIEESISVSASGYHINNVSLKGKLFTVNKKKVYNNIKEFVAGGGVAYFSDYSYFLLQGAFRTMYFFDDFPNMGISGTFPVTLKGPLKKFVSPHSMQVTFPHSGWVAVREFSGSETLVQCSFDTIRGRKTGPLISMAKYGDGEMLYSSYHTDDYTNPLTRFIVFRIAYSNFIETIRNEIRRWEQQEEYIGSDIILDREYSRRYSIELKTGNNTLYLHAPGGSFQVDIFSSSGSLLYSRDGFDGSQVIDIGSRNNVPCVLYMYPSKASHMKIFSIGIASGARLFPHQSRIFYGMILIFALTITVLLLKMWNPRRLSGRLYKTIDRYKTENK